jgi:hypothetical protein
VNAVRYNKIRVSLTNFWPSKARFPLLPGTGTKAPQNRAHWRNYSPNIGVTEIAENKMKWYLTVFTIDYIDLKKKTVIQNLTQGC